jgi:hypothetical protein
MLDPEPEVPAPGSVPRRVVFLALAVAATGLLGSLALYLGAWGFDFRRFAQHNGRLWRLLEHEPRMDQVVEALQAEGSPLLASPQGEGALRAEAAARGGAKAAEVMEKGRRFRNTRVFQAADMVYFIYFDDAGIMRDFTCASR